VEKQPVEISEKDLRVQQSEKIVDFLSRIGAYEYIQKLKSGIGNDFLEKPSFEEFRDFLIRINGILRDIPINKRDTDGKTVYMSGFDEALMPKHDDKEGILREAYDSLDKIKLGDESYLLPAVVNAVHMFADGNGRTSRVLHTLLESKSKEEFTENLKLAVGEYGRHNVENINPGIVGTDIEKIVLMKHGIKFEEGEAFVPIFPEGFSLLFSSVDVVTTVKAKQFMDFRRIDQAYCFIAAYEFLKEKGLLDNVLLEIPSGKTLSPLKMEQLLTETDWGEIIERYYNLKKEHVEILIDSFIDPDSYKSLDGETNIRDSFIDEIKFELAKNEGVGQD